MKKFSIILFFSLSLSPLLSFPVIASEITLDSQATLTISSGDLVDMKCWDITITEFSTLALNGGKIVNRGRISIVGDGRYLKINGSEEKCYPMYFVIPDKNGNMTVISL